MQVVTDEGTTGHLDLKVVVPLLDECPGGGGIVRQDGVIEADMDLVHHRGAARQRRETVRRNQNDVVRWCRRTGVRRRSHDLEQRVGGGKVDDPVDGERGGRAVRRSDGDCSAGNDRQVRGGLLGKQHTACATHQRPDLTGKHRGVVRGHGQDLGLPGLAAAIGSRRRQRGDRDPVDGDLRSQVRQPPDRGRDAVGITLRCHLDLPVDGHAGGCPDRQLGGADGDETTQRGDEGHSYRNAHGSAQHRGRGMDHQSPDP